MAHNPTASRIRSSFLFFIFYDRTQKERRKGVMGWGRSWRVVVPSSVLSVCVCVCVCLHFCTEFAYLRFLSLSILSILFMMFVCEYVYSWLKTPKKKTGARTRERAKTVLTLILAQWRALTFKGVTTHTRKQATTRKSNQNVRSVYLSACICVRVYLYMCSLCHTCPMMGWSQSAIASMRYSL